jgi:hypothetical protein
VTSLSETNVLVVTQKIVAKAAGRFVDLGSVAPGAEAVRPAEITRQDPRLVELVRRESTAIVRAAPNVLITRHRLGYVIASSGIDRSNFGRAAAIAFSCFRWMPMPRQNGCGRVLAPGSEVRRRSWLRTGSGGLGAVELSMSR